MMLKKMQKTVLTILTIVALMGVSLHAAGKTADPGAVDHTASLLEKLTRVNIDALERFAAYLELKHPSVHAMQKGRLAEIRRLHETDGLAERVKKKDPKAIATAKRILRLREDLLLSNPELNFDRMFLIKHTGGRIPLPANWQSNSSIRGKGWNNAIMSMPLRGSRKLKEVYRPDNTECITDIDLHFDGKRMLFSMPGKNQRWQVFELPLDAAPAELPLIGDSDVHNYDACYLPDGNIIFTSTAPFIGVPCVKGSSHVTNCYLFNPTTKSIRRLTFDQEHNWCPTVTSSGQVMYLRWEYSDIPHFVSRILFTMNPDGTNQRASYGTNSYWPNSIFYARPIPGSASKFVGIVTGHHGVKRMGELVLFDAAKGYREADGVIQRIGDYGKKVEPVIIDRLADRSWPKFLHPYPINERFFIVSAKLNQKGNWGIYLADVFDNMLLLKEEQGNALLEPTPIIARPTPPVIPSKVHPDSKDAIMFITDIYEGDGLKGVPRGTVKQLRLITYQFAYHDMGGQANRVGLDGPWDVKRVLGTVPVEADGSAMFTVPADTPISIQPLDSRGRAIALMRSWATAMPGEVLSCVGCHEAPNKVVPASRRIASSKAPSTIKPWYGPTRGFSFIREVQPVLDKYCVGCHDGSKAKLPDFRNRPAVHPASPNKTYAMGTKFPPSYLALRRYVRTPTIESDIHLLPPYEFHASTTELIQRLEAGHNNVKLDRQAWDRLYTWIDLHTPAHGSWQQVVGKPLVDKYRQRRIDLMKQYSSRSDDEELIAAAGGPIDSIMPEPMPIPPTRKQPKELSPAQALKQQQALGSFTKTVSAEGVDFQLTKVPGIEGQSPFWIGTFEITNQQFQAFDPTHDSRFEHGDFLVFSVRGMGYPLNKPKQPVCRVSWQQATEFCKWLSKKTGRRFRLPAASQWQRACRAGTTTDHWYGPSITDFSPYANLADQSFKHVDKFEFALPEGAIPKWRPAIESVDDKFHVSSPVGTFKPNPWGLHDMHGNVAEWTATGNDNAKVVKGGSWSDRPNRATTDFKITYHPWQKVFNVGFRVVMEE